MQTIKCLLPYTLLLFGTCGFTQVNNSPETVIKAWEEMWNTYDLAQVDRLFVTDQSATYFSSEFAGLIKGIDAVRNHHAKFGFVYGGRQATNRLWLKDVRYQRNTKTCLVTATWYFQRQGAAQPQAGPVTFLLIRLNNTWHIQHAHFSNNP